ncbi:hypothetical protein CY0110_17672 [Crocosphaera chwakensis CCY0110]|uniref:Uncharacterized protein n=1 Tax=Crocosphaera chwakensis CCY0110 TaxID=391612 RepID=A3IIL6_9CHRO|nr:hypothetical protein CY0110_17672 [Crocosphaera chwakensis CCY0110]
MCLTRKKVGWMLSGLLKKCNIKSKVPPTPNNLA